MTDDEIKKRIDENLEKIKVHLITLFGDEGHDIGDAGNWAELLGNTIPHMNAPHESYLIGNFLTCIATLVEIPLADLLRLYDEIKTWDSTKFNQEGAWTGWHEGNIKG